MSFRTGGVAVAETCSCGAHIEAVSATGWLDHEKVREQLEKWREQHVHDATDAGENG